MALGVAIFVICTPLALLLGSAELGRGPSGPTYQRSQIKVVYVQDGSATTLMRGYEYTLIGGERSADTGRIDYAACEVTGPGVSGYRLLKAGAYAGHPFFEVTATGPYTMTCGSGVSLYLNGTPAGVQAAEDGRQGAEDRNIALGFFGLLGGPAIVLIGLVLLLVQSLRRGAAISRLAAAGASVSPLPARSFVPGTLALAVVGAGLGLWLTGMRSQRFGGLADLYLMANRALWVITPLLILAAVIAWVIDGQRRDRDQARRIRH